MPEIASILDQQALANLVSLNLDEPAKQEIRRPRHHERCQCVDCKAADAAGIPRFKSGVAQTSKGPVTYIVTKPSTQPVPPKRPRQLTAADAIEIDPESEALVPANCVDCGVEIMLDPKLPEGIAVDALRVPICEHHAKVRAMYAAAVEQRNVEAIRRPQVARHQPRVTDHIDHPVTVTTKEQDMDLSEIADAEIGSMLKEQIRMDKAEKVKAGAKQAKKERKAEAKRFEAERTQAQAERKGKVLPAFMVGTTLEVPALDLSAVPSMDESPSAKERSPYNKARFRLTKEGPLDPETTTYRMLAAEHERLMSAEAERIGVDAVEVAKPVEQPEQIVAVIDTDEKAKVKALAKVLGCSKKEAKAILATMNA